MNGLSEPLQLYVALGAGGALLLLVILLLTIKGCVRFAAPGEALVLHRPGGAAVSLARAIVLPIISRAERLRVTAQPLLIERCGRDAVRCRDNVRADVRAVFLLQVNLTRDDILKVASRVGCARGSDPQALLELHAATFGEALANVARTLDFEELLGQRERFCAEVIRSCGEDLEGFRLRDLSLPFCEQTPLAAIDPHNSLDAKGIKKVAAIVEECTFRTQTLEKKDAEAAATHARTVAALREEVAKLPS